MMIVLLFEVFIANLPIYIVNVQSAVCVSYDFLKYKTDADIK